MTDWRDDDEYYQRIVEVVDDLESGIALEEHAGAIAVLEYAIEHLQSRLAVLRTNKAVIEKAAAEAGDE